MEPDYTQTRSMYDVIFEHFGVRKQEEAASLMYRDRGAPPLPASNYSKLKLPYEAASHPGIPTISEFTQGMKDNRLSSKFAQHPEAENLLFLQEHSQVRVPKLYAVFTGPEGEHYIVTEFIEGDSYDGDDKEKWGRLTEDARTKICSKIAEQFRLLRSVPGEGYYGRVHNQGWHGWQSMFRLGSRKPKGPFNTYNEFVSAILKTIEFQTAFRHFDKEFFDPDEVAFLPVARRFLATSSRGHEPKLTHADPALWNMRIRKVIQKDGAEDWEVTFIDWAEMGWYPAWMQSVMIQLKIYWRRAAPERKDVIRNVLEGIGDDYSEYVEFFEELKGTLQFSVP
ncbi:hypothetical protein IQ07DRAFT_628868 [Pyrenochaeta sp. DS3sAY3a]|nr:hypothetical protein IQ07DRAFT_628868 [Pyrenochaeta sp. DS3sAY3a]